jgi:triphosphoribosyl-dephospho-CoA synthase
VVTALPVIEVKPLPLAGVRRALRSRSAAIDATLLADHAVAALIDEAHLTPKPALVDRRGSGAHRDLDLATMIRSANALQPGFAAMARAAAGRSAGGSLREELAAIGRDAEGAMLAATGGSNAHRGAIWVLGLLVAGAAMAGDDRSAPAIARRAASVARHDDRFAPRSASNGVRACERYGVSGARGEARAGFPHVVRIGIPALLAARARGCDEPSARLDALMAIMARLDDTCLLHRGGDAALAAAKAGAREVLARGGTASTAGRRALLRLDADLLSRNASPGGSADLLSAVLLLDRLAAPAPGLPLSPSSWR